MLARTIPEPYMIFRLQNQVDPAAITKTHFVSDQKTSDTEIADQAATNAALQHMKKGTIMQCCVDGA